MAETARIQAIYRYPVKGFSPERLDRTELRTGQTVPNDRRYAVENGPSGFDPAEPKYFPKSYFLMLMRDERLAALHTRYDDDSHVLTIAHDGREVARGDLETKDGRLAMEAFLRRYMPGELKGPPKVLSGPPHSFSDVPRKVVSIINLASVAALEDLTGKPVDPLRFRANIYVEGLPAWREFDLLDRTIAIGAARLNVVKPIVRCAAVNVNLATAERDMNLPQLMMQRLGHADCGIYAEVVADGAIAAGDAIGI